MACPRITKRTPWLLCLFEIGILLTAVFERFTAHRRYFADPSQMWTASELPPESWSDRFRGTFTSGAFV